MIPPVSRSFAERLEKDDSYVIELVCGHDAAGQPCHHVLLVAAARVEELRRNLLVKTVELEEYGEVLAAGDGHELPDGFIDELHGLLLKK